MATVLFETLWSEMSDGWSIAARAYARAMLLGGLDVRLRSWAAMMEEPHPSVLAEVEGMLGPPPESGWDCYTYSAPLASPKIMRHPLEVLLNMRRPRTLYTMFERTNVQNELVAAMRQLEGVMVPCSANREVLAVAGLENVTYVPFPYFDGDPHLGLPPPRERPRVLYWIGRWEPRKAPDNLVRAFLRAFKPGEAELVLKIGPVPWKPLSRQNSAFPEPEEVIAEEWSNGARHWSLPQAHEAITIIRGRQSPEEMLLLHARGDVYVSASRGEGLCAAQGTLIDTINGQVPIEEIQEGDLVNTHLGRFKKVTQTMSRQWNGDLIFIKPHGLREELAFTPEHPHYVVRRDSGRRPYLGRFHYLVNETMNSEFVEASRLAKGDLWVVPKREKLSPVSATLRISEITDAHTDGTTITCKLAYTPSSQMSITALAKEIGCKFQHVSRILRGDRRAVTTLGRRIKEYAEKFGVVVRAPVQIPDVVNLTPEVMFFLGHYLAEGCSGRSSGLVELSTHTKESWGRKLSAEGIRQAFNLRAREICYPARPNNTKLLFSNAVVARFLNALCGAGSHNKFIDVRLKSSPNVHHLLRGLFYGDGCLSSSDHKFKFSTASPKLAADIVEILNRAQIFATKSRNVRRNGACIFDVGVVSQHAIKFVEFVHPVKYAAELSAPPWGDRRFLLEDDRNFYLPIQRIERRYYDGMVHNFSVEEDESYTSHGYATHNCLPAFAAKLAGRRIVTTDSGGPRDFLGEGDVLVPSTGDVPAPDYEAFWGEGARYADYRLDDLVAALQAVVGAAGRPSPMPGQFRAAAVGARMRDWIEACRG